MKKYKIFYTGYNKLFYSKANTINILKMSQHFNRHSYCDLFLPINHNSIKDLQIKDYIKKLKFDYLLDENFNINLSKVSSSISIIYFYIVAIKKLNKKKYDFTYTRDIKLAFILVLLKKNVCIELHGLSFISNLIKKKIFKFIFTSKYLKLLIPISNELKNDVIKQFGNLSSKIYVAHDAAEKIPNNIKLDNPYATKKKNILFLSSMYPGKGLETISKISKNLNEFNFNIVGGSLKDIKKTRLKNLSFPKNVIFHGRVTYRETKAFLFYCDLCIAPLLDQIYIEDSDQSIGRWTSPLKIFEYMSAKKILISSNLRTITEVLEHNKDSILIDPNDHREWINAIKKIDINNFEMSNNIFQKFIKNYTWDIRVKNILKAYK